MASRFARHVRALLQSQADPAVKRSYERYFKGQLPFLGVKGPAVQRVFREASASLTSAAPDDVVTEALTLLRSRWAEEKQVAVLLLHRHRRVLPTNTLQRLEPVFDDAVHEWATCDGLSGRVLRYLVQRSATERRRVVGWSRSRNPWRQRASAVAFLHGARHGACTGEILRVCERLVRNPHRFVQLGMGWVLRELWLAEPAIVVAFLEAHFPSVSREGLRYAIEKMPRTLQESLLSRHKVAPRAPRRSR